MGGGTLLVKEGEVNVSKGGRNVTYTAIGIKADGTVVSMVCYGQRYPVSCGYTQYEVAEMMKARGCQTALLLDGSGSSTFVSRREGDSQVITRNNPSDGQERQVSSSLFIVSDVNATGEFDHAGHHPGQRSPTPPAPPCQLQAVGADPSGAPRPCRKTPAGRWIPPTAPSVAARAYSPPTAPWGSHGVPAERR